jgi:hypothetical protein
MADLPSAVTLTLERHQNTPHHLAHQVFLGGTLLTPCPCAEGPPGCGGYPPLLKS